MNQEKIGKFIKECRKRKNLTQEELGEYLGVSNRSISKYENGKCMPDISLLKPICNILGITLNELLSGEYLDDKSYKEKSEINLSNTIDYINKKDSYLIILLIILSSILSLYLYIIHSTLYIALLLISIVLLIYINKSYIFKIIYKFINIIKKNNNIFGIIVLLLSFITIATSLFYLNNILLLIISIVLLIIGIYSLLKKGTENKIIILSIVLLIYIISLICINYYIVIPNSKLI